MEFRRVDTSVSSIGDYVGLFALCFPGVPHLSSPQQATAYLSWLYNENPVGTAVGFDAWDGEVLSAHYSTIPVCWSFSGKFYNGLLSLNTATHPDYQGQGLFTQLACKTYELANEMGYDFIVGVANKNSTPGFLRKLDFTHVLSLDARIGFGSLPHETQEYLCNAVDLINHHWTEEALAWRVSNPNNLTKITRQNRNFCQILASTNRLSVKAYAEVYQEFGGRDSDDAVFGPRLMLGWLPRNLSWGGHVSIPEVFKPSPLNLIFRPLRGSGLSIDPDALYFNFLDFDAY